MPIAAIAGRTVFNDVTGKHHVLIRYVNHSIPRRMRPAHLQDIYPALAQIDAHSAIKGRGGPGEARNTFMALKQPWKALKFAIPIFLTALGNHGPCFFRHDNLPSAVSRCAKHAHRVVMGQHQMADWLIRYGAHAIDDFLRQAWCCLSFDNHNAVVADDNPRVWITFGGKRIEPFAHFGKADLFFFKIAS